MALLIGYGASAVNPYLAIETVEDMVDSGDLDDGPRTRPCATWSRRTARAS